MLRKNGELRKMRGENGVLNPCKSIFGEVW